MELVLALPLMLCAMALMINFGNAAVWKVRAATSSRLVIWRARPLFMAMNDPKPANWWPASTTMEVIETERITQVDSDWDHSLIAQPWIKGPAMVVNGGYLVVRDKRFNGMSEGVAIGRAEIKENYPLMPALGKMSLRADYTMLDTEWGFSSMGYGRNAERRSKDWWVLEESADWSREKQNFLESDMRIRTNPNREALRPLDRDPIVMKYRSPLGFDFYPRKAVECTYYLQEIQNNLNIPGGFLDEIRGRNGQPGVNAYMTSAFLYSYREWLEDLMTHPESDQALIPQVQQWIQEQEEFFDLVY